MSLRLLVVVLAVANLLLWAWGRGALHEIGWTPESPSEPARLEQQIRPEAFAVRLLEQAEPLAVDSNPDVGEDQPARAADEPELMHESESQQSPDQESLDEQDAGEVAGGERAKELEPFETGRPESESVPVQEPEPPRVDHEPASSASVIEVGKQSVQTQRHARARAEGVVCLQAGPFDLTQAQALRSAADVLPEGTWQLDRVAGRKPRWMVYLGDFGDELAMLTRRKELQAAGLDVDRAGAAFAPGLSLGRYSSLEGAERALAALQGEPLAQGARVVQERGGQASYTLRIEAEDGAWRQRVQQLPLAGRRLRPCA